MANSTFRHLYTDTLDGQSIVKNYIKNAFANENVNGWAPYSNTPGPAPVTGTGSSGGTQTVAQVTTNNTTVNSINPNQWPAQSFTTSTATTILSASLKLDQVGGTGATGNMVIGVYTVSGGNPGTLLGTSDPVNANTLTSTPTNTTFTFTSGPSLSASTQYFIVLQPTSVTFNSSVIEIARDNTNPYSGGQAFLSLNAGSTWSATTGSDLTFNVTGTGGVDVTITRNTSSPLRNEADFLFTKDAANRQGEGVSYDFTIDKADQTKLMSVSFDYSASAAFVTGTNSDMQVFVYDITNAVLIPVSRSSILAPKGFFYGTFPTNTSQSYRLILHVATTNASAYTLEFTNVEVNTIQTLAQGAIVTEWQPFSMVITAVTSNPTLGTVIESSAFFRRVGDSAQVTFAFRQTAPGTAGSGHYLFSLPPGLAFDPNKLNDTEGGSGPYILGYAQPAFSTAGSVIPSSPSDDANHLNLQILDTLGNCVGSANYGLDNSNQYYGFNAIVPILNWTSGVASINSSNLVMSNLLANGTRVTGASPTALGEYRSMLRIANTTTFTDVNGTPSPLPSAPNGIKIWTANGATNGDPNNQPSRYEIFVGKQKTIRLEFYQNTGRTGYFDPDVMISTASADIGIFQSYDPTTGVVILESSVIGGNPQSYVGVDPTQQTPIANGYFDIFVADNMFQIQVGGASTIGDVQTSMLSETQFQSYRSTDWVLMDGRDVTGSMYALVTGNTLLPDMRGRFQRMKDYGAGNDVNYGDVPVGTVEADFFQNHNHTFGITSNPGGTPGTYGATGGPQSFVFGYIGGANGNASAETQPKAIVVNMFIKIN